MHWLIVLFSLYAEASTKSLCGADERSFSHVREVGRAIMPGAETGCTLTMIGKSCALSAGHCFKDLQVAQFNMYLDKDKLIANPEDTYMVDAKASTFSQGGEGKDWAVVRLTKNALTGLWPGDVQGKLAVNFDTEPKVGDLVSITGFGWLNTQQSKNAPQQTHSDVISFVTKIVIGHQVDTMGGNSGSSLVGADGRIIGIHTHGGCYRNSGANKATMLFKNEALKVAINTCLKWERSKL